MSNNYNCFFFYKFRQSFLNKTFIFNIKRCCSFIKQYNRCIFKNSPCY